MDGLLLKELAAQVRQDFPILEQTVNGHKLVYLDNAATSQKPRPVLHAMQEFYGRYNSNVHRAIHKLSEEATEKYEEARKTVARFIGANHREIIFTKGTTESLNLASNCLKHSLKRNDKILFTEMEHHSNIVPWFLAAGEKNARTSAVKITDEGILDEESLEAEIADAKIFAFTHASNMLGTVNDAATLCKKAKENGAISVMDAAQSVPHMPLDVKKLGCDFLAFSGHKMLGPTGIGVLYGRRELLEQLPPFLGGGDMIKEVFIDHFIPAEPPAKFEAGTPPIAEAIALAEAVRYLENIGMDNVLAHEKALAKTAIDILGKIEKLQIYGPRERIGVISFNIEGIPGHDMASILDSRGIAVRSGHHCAMPLHMRLGLEGSTRASFYIYNSEEEIEALAEGIKHAKKVFGV